MAGIVALAEGGDLHAVESRIGGGVDELPVSDVDAAVGGGAGGIVVVVEEDQVDLTASFPLVILARVIHKISKVRYKYHD